MADLGIGEGIIQDVADAAASKAPSWASIPIDFLAVAIPQIMCGLAAGETPVAIGAPYVLQAIELGAQVVRDLLAGKNEQDAKRALDEALFALLEDLKYPKVV